MKPGQMDITKPLNPISPPKHVGLSFGDGLKTLALSLVLYRAESWVETLILPSGGGTLDE